MVTDPHDEAPWRSWDREEWWEYEPDCGMVFNWREICSELRRRTGNYHKNIHFIH